MGTKKIETKVHVRVSKPSYGDGRKVFTLSVEDEKSSRRLVEAEFTYDQLIEMLMGVGAHGNATIFVGDHIGKEMENEPFIFPIEGFIEYNRDSMREVAITTVGQYLEEGWEADTYYGSQNSFFVKDGVQYARTTIRRWV